jgi:HD superfamily phosphohydrolase
VLGPKATHAAESYLVGLFQLYPTVYFHKATRGAEKLFSEILLRVIELVRQGAVPETGLSANHPIVLLTCNSCPLN